MKFFYIKAPPEKALKAFAYDFKYPELLLMLSKQKGDSWPLLGPFPIRPVLLGVLIGVLPHGKPGRGAE
jgi:hypothetical protein